LDIIKPYKAQKDPWHSLRAFTAARIALGRTGNAMPLHAVLQLKLAHAHARDAVYSQLEMPALLNEIQLVCEDVVAVQSNVTSRSQYLKRPDCGRMLNEDSIKLLNGLPNDDAGISITLADGLSAKAINKHAIPVLKLLIPLLKKSGYNITPLCIATQARVALGDHIGSLLKAKLALMLIGERPGLTSPESMGAYITYEPTTGLTDERRNCISNIRPEGFGYQLATEKIFYLIQQSLRLKLSGTALKDDQYLLPGN
jgi:ethanolamine ammonia-lyase small subunit